MDLVSIAPATKTVALGSAAVEVTGLSLRKLTQLLVSFPDLVAVIIPGTLDPVALVQQAPDAALAVFSLGVVGKAKRPWWQRRGMPLIADGDDDFLAAFDAAPAGQQIEALGAIFDLTSKGSERALPFLAAVFARRAPAEPAPAPPTTTPPIDATPAASTPNSPSI